MDRFALMSTFVRIVETGSLSATARELGSTQPTVSKQLSALEQLAGARLMERNTRAIRLTEAGARYYEVARRVITEVDTLNSDLGGLRQEIRGRLKLSLPVGMGEMYLVKIALQFQREHPDVVLDLSLTDRVVDLVEDGVDVAVRIGGVTDPSVIARHLGFFHYLMLAAPSYLKAHGTPKRVEELSQHNYLRYYVRGAAEETLITPKGPVNLAVKSNVEVNNSLALLEALVSGVGLGRCTRWMAAPSLKAGKLVEILPGVAPPPLSTHAVYLPSRQTPVKVRRFVEYLEAEVQKLPGWSPKSSASR